MLRVIGKDIYLTRGDTASLNVKISQYGCNKPYVIMDGDKVFMTVKNSFNVKDFVFQKVVSYEDLIDGNIIFKIIPSDTNELEFGDYVYDVEIKTSEGDVFTIIPPSAFKLEPEVTYYSNEVV